MDTHCYYSDLPSPLAYEKIKPQAVLSEADINRIIEMAWEDRTPFEAIKIQFDLSESAVRALMKKKLKFSSYVLWRKRVEACSTKHLQTRQSGINRFKSKLQRSISNNKITKR